MTILRPGSDNSEPPNFHRQLISISRKHKVRRSDDGRALAAINEFLDGIDATGQREALHLAVARFVMADDELFAALDSIPEQHRARVMARTWCQRQLAAHLAKRGKTAPPNPVPGPKTQETQED